MTELMVGGNETLARAYADPDRAYELDRRHVFHSWSAQASLDPMVVGRQRVTADEARPGLALLDHALTTASEAPK